MEGVIRRIWDGLKFGETVLVEHGSTTNPALGFYHLLRWAKEKGYPVLIDDILDTLYLYRVHLKLAGLDTSLVEEARVIKEGGTLNVGQVVEQLGVKEPAIQNSNYERVFEPLLSGGGQIINPVLGIGKMLSLANSKREMLTTINSILSYTGDERRIALYFVNVDLTEKDAPYILPFLEEIATTVVRVNREGRGLKFSVIKSVNHDIEGIEVKM